MLFAQFLSISCLVSVAMAAPKAEAQLPFAPWREAVAAAPVATLPASIGHAVEAATLPATVVAPNCEIEYEIIETQSCIPRSETVCKKDEIKTQSVRYERKCKEVTSVHCPGVGLPSRYFAKRDAEADPQYLYAVAEAPAVATVKSSCHEVTTEHCLDSPYVVEKVLPIENCRQVVKVDCEPVEKKIPKTMCTPIETQVVSKAHYHPFAYGYGY